MRPVNVISGFLGAGKTSLILDCLTYLEASQNVAIIENEFGDINTDSKYLQKNNRLIYEIANGCVCCGQKDKFSLLLEKLAREERLDRLIIEPSGVFIIDTIFELFNQDSISAYFYIESITVVVDAVIFSDIAYLPFVRQQIKMASIVVINKSNMTKNVNLVTELVRDINSNVEIIYRADKLSAFDASKLFSYKRISLSNQEIITHNFKVEQAVFNVFSTKEQLEKYILNESPRLLRAKGMVQIRDKTYEVSYSLSEFNYWQVYDHAISENKLIMIYR